MATLEAAIDDVYKAPLEEFVSVRTTIVKTLTGTDAKRVKGLSKPTAVAWAVNQVYWHARATYDRVAKTGEKLRASQIAALNGRHADVRQASVAHTAAVADAVKTATRLAAAHGVRPDSDALARMFEAVSLTTAPPEPPGRFTKALAPAGFEALAGVEIATIARPHRARHAPADAAKKEAPAETTNRRESSSQAAAREKQARRAERERLAAENRKQTAIKKAETAVMQARTVEARAREAWDRAKRALDDAQRTLETTKK